MNRTLDEFYDLPEAEDWIADWELQREVCPYHGGPYDECTDAEQDWFPQRTVCYPTMQLEAAKEWYRELHKDEPFHDGTFKFWSKERTPITFFRYDEGVAIGLSKEDLTPDDDFLGQGLRSVREETPEQ